MKKIKLYKKFDIGGTTGTPAQISPNTKKSGLSAIPYVGAFADVGKTVNNTARQEDQYGVAKTNANAGIGAAFNPSKQITRGVKEGNYVGGYNSAAFAVFNPIGAAAYQNQEDMKAREIMLNTQRDTDFNQQNQQMLESSSAQGFDSRGNGFGNKYLKKGGLLNKYPDGGIMYTDHEGRQFSKLPDRVDRFGNITFTQDPLNHIAGQTPDGNVVIREGELLDRLDSLNPNRRKVLSMPGIQRTPSQIDSLRRQGLLAKGGVVKDLSSTTVEFNGKTHAEGGIKEPVVKGKKLIGNEVEDNETMSVSPDGQRFVFSEELGFAKKHKPLAKAMGKIEKKLLVNPNDPISTRTLQGLKEREEQLKVEQETYKLAANLPSDLDSLKYGGKTKSNTNWYTRDGLAMFPLGGIPYEEGQEPRNSFGNQYATGYSPVMNTTIAPTSQPIGTIGDYSGMGSNNFSSPRSRSSFDFQSVGNIANKVAPYAGVVANYNLNEQSKKINIPKERLPDFVKYNPIDLTAQRLEADNQRRELNNNLTRNVTNSATANALKAKNLATTIRAKNLINSQETNTNIEGSNRYNLINNGILQRRNQIDVGNRDREYNRDQAYLQQKGKIINNGSDIYQQQSRDSKLYDLEDRKIALLQQQDLNRGIYDRYLGDAAKKQKKAYKLGGIMKSKKC